MSERHLDKSIKISDLLVTQCSLRVLDRVEKMVEFVKRGGTFSPDRVAEFHCGELNRFGLIILSRFPNGDVYVHDGHHRSVAAHLGGREYFSFEERTIIEWDSIDRYKEINPVTGWVTPLDLETEVRLADFLDFKQDALALEGEFQEAFIRRNRNRYVTPRCIRTIPEMCDQVTDLLNQRVSCLAAR